VTLCVKLFDELIYFRFSFLFLFCFVLFCLHRIVFVCFVLVFLLSTVEFVPRCVEAVIVFVKRLNNKSNAAVYQTCCRSSLYISIIIYLMVRK